MSTISHPPSRFPLSILVFVIFGLFICMYIGSTLLPSLPPGSDHLRNNKEEQYNRSSGKNGKHSNPDARQSAEQKIDEVKKEIDRLVQKPNKSKEEASQLEKLRDKLKHLRKKKDWSGETHSRTRKGN